MFYHEVLPIEIRSQSSEARLFWKKSYKPAIQPIVRRINENQLSLLLCVPKRKDAIRHRLSEIEDGFAKQNIQVSFLFSLPNDDEYRTLLKDLEEKGKGYDVVLIVISEGAALINGLLHLSPAVSAKLFIFMDQVFHQTLKTGKAYTFKELFERTQLFNAEKRTLFYEISHAIKALRLAKYLRSKFIEDNNATKSGLNLFSLYQDYKAEIDIFLGRGCLFLLAFIRYLSHCGYETLKTHLSFNTNALDQNMRLFIDNGFIAAEAGSFRFTPKGHLLFDLFKLKNLPIIEIEKNLFKERWKEAIQKTFTMNYNFNAQTQRLKNLSNRFYDSLVRQIPIFREIRYFMKKHLYFWLSEAEAAFFDDETTQKLFQLWKENIYGLKSGWRPEIREQIAFLEYMFDLYKISHHPNHAETFRNYKDLVFSLSMLRPNTQAHIYLSYSFEQRPNKDAIRQYFRIAAITGQYDVLLKRFNPYHNMLNLAIAPGQRTLFDTRGLDFRPITIRLDLKYSLALELGNVQTRKGDRFITCPIVTDSAAEKEKAALLQKFQEDIKGIFASPDHLNQFEFSEDGKIYVRVEGKHQEAPFYGMKRALLIQKQDELNLLKAIPRPGAKSGIIIRFNLLDPVAVLLNGLNRKRDIQLDDIRYVLKCLDLYAKEAGKPLDQRKPLDALIDRVFEFSEPEGLKEDTLEMMHELERLQIEDPSDESAWRFLTFRLIEGKHNALLQTICHRLMAQCFELVFSLWPMITGVELQMDDSGMEIQEKPLDKEKKQLLPLLDNLRRELQDLLKNVFSKYVDISAATKWMRSEPQIAEMIVKHCLNVKSDSKAFKEKLTDHLRRHYDAHFNFLNEYLVEDGIPSVLKNIHKLEVDVEKQITEDASGIIGLINETRNRLFSRLENNRLLCFIAPDSVDVQIGDFYYEGESMTAENTFIEEKVMRQNELANMKRDAIIETRTAEMEQDQLSQRRETEIAKLRIQEEKAKEEAEVQKRINEAHLTRITSEINIALAEALKRGDLKEYSVLALYKAGQEVGPQAVEELLEKSPNMLMAISPETYQLKENQKRKQQLVEFVKQQGKDLDPVTMALLFGEGSKDAIGIDMYKEINKTLTETLKNTRLGQMPFFSPMIDTRAADAKPSPPNETRQTEE